MDTTMNGDQLTIGVALTGSFCTLGEVLPQLAELAKTGAILLPIVSGAVADTDTRFGSAAYFLQRLEEITGRPALTSLAQVEPIGPKKLLDILLVSPCTGNTLSKLALGITDTAVTMACKAHLRNGRPLVLAPATNDALGASAANLGRLHNTRHVFFVPYRQDDPHGKENSMVADFTLIIPALEAALQNRQLQPVIL